MSEFANPLPPPPRKEVAAKPKQLSNTDFKMLLATPRPGGRSQLSNLPSGRKVSLPRDDEGGVDGEEKHGHKPKKRPPRPSKLQEESEEPELPKYRDRAKERREGRLLDYEHANADLAALMEGQEMDVSKISVEDSKYLGGDVEHTHLVKGLDFALLQKMRGDQKSKGEHGEDAETKDKDAAIKADKPAIRFLTPMGRAVYRAVLDQPASAPVEAFLPGRMAFVYSFEEDELGNQPPDMPTTLRRSKADCPKLPPMMLGGMDRALMERIATVMSYVQLAPGGKKSKLKKKDRARILAEYGIDQKSKDGIFQQLPVVKAVPAAAAPERPAPSGDDDDIFEDAGRDYVCDLEAGKAQDQDGGTASYFDSKDDMEDLPPIQGPARPPPGAATYSFGNEEDDMEVDDDNQLPPPPPPPEDSGPALPKSGEERQQPKQEGGAKGSLKGFADEAYAELYPDFQLGGEVVDSDEEGGGDKMDLGRQGKVKTRYDFSTEEEYTQYKQSQEANPKAAFQFGLKREGGRKASSALGKKGPDSQMNSDLSKIKNILKEKGHKKDMVAFEAPAEDPAPAATKRRKRV
eukprot:CAMPEP_0117680412 /NCGR_PEP_ID=MMETSP0804-20121206/18339_1 /TAXON_ID=1074897 /ORGANISM="Tetraselmis astigmatica, Strain CCMP880" /LENGTH=574 /DNA_ID=CAMNT_0005489909 /DNA_START=73 /DNA_END=1797 /DNA_ORIENTATION=-